MAIETPPKSYGGLEQVVWNHAKGLADLGEDVTLVGAHGSVAPPGVKLLAFEDPGSFDESGSWWYYRHILADYDVVLDHSWQKWSYLAGDYLPVVGTMHSPCPFMAKDQAGALRGVPPPKRYPMLCGVSAEHSKFASKMLGLPVRTTWNSVDVSRFEFSSTPGDTLLSINRIDPAKGIHVFIDWCSKAGAKGDVVGDDTLVQDKQYPINMKKACELYKVDWSGKVSHDVKFAKIRECKAVVLLPQAPGYLEVFGLAAVEANAVGRPVICTPNCGLKDIIIDGENGFLVSTFDEFKAAVAKLGTISPQACRKQAERWDIPVIVPKYRDIIKQVNDGCRW